MRKVFIILLILLIMFFLLPSTQAKKEIYYGNQIVPFDDPEVINIENYNPVDYIMKTLR